MVKMKTLNSKITALLKPASFTTLRHSPLDLMVEKTEVKEENATNFQNRRASH